MPNNEIHNQIGHQSDLTQTGLNYIFWQSWKLIGKQVLVEILSRYSENFTIASLASDNAKLGTSISTTDLPWNATRMRKLKKLPFQDLC
jgi:hypothetical protein